jgi:methionyl-tRNA synthetase
MPSKPFYITTTLPYVNAEPHIGFAGELIRADAIARWKKLQGDDVFFNTGTDEHGLKIYKKAVELGIEPQKYVDEMAAKFKEILPALGISPDVNFIRTTDSHHVKAAQEFWKLVDKNGYIYKKNYSVKYCVGCELEKTESELVDGRCPLHPLQELEPIQEENYFFKASAFTQRLLDLYKNGGEKVGNTRLPFVIPESRLNEISAFITRGLEDFSISRLKDKMPWGVPVPGDDKQVMYVWFDALVNYISAIGWPDDVMGDAASRKSVPGAFKKWSVDTGGMVQYCGKDNLRQQTAMWQAMLMAAGLPASKTIIIDGFVTGEGGVKMSKSLGNTVDLLALIKEFGTEAVRYYCLREIHPFEDSPVTAGRFKESYNANLANGLGNLVSRVMKMAADNISGPVLVPEDTIPEAFKKAIDSYNIQAAANVVWQKIADMDAKIQTTQPFKLIKTDKAAATKIISELVVDLYTIGRMLNPIMPETSKTIKELIKTHKMPAAPLFLRK